MQNSPSNDADLIARLQVPDLGSDDVIAFSDPDPAVAVINFSSMNPGKFERWKWFYHRRVAGYPALYVFLRDENQHYYLGTEDKPTYPHYRRIIAELLKRHGISSDRVLSIGSSMGGYASLHFACKMGFAGSICISPQVDLESAKLHKLSLWARKIEQTGALWEDLDSVVLNCVSPPVVYLRTSNYAADSSAADRLEAALRVKSTAIVRCFDRVDEHGWFGPSSSSINSVIQALFQLADTHRPPAARLDQSPSDSLVADDAAKAPDVQR